MTSELRYSTAAPAPLPVEEFSIVELRRGVARRWRWLVAIPLAAGALGAGAAVLWPKTWTATTSFVLEATLGSNNTAILSSLGGIGSLLGEAGGVSALSRLKDGPSTDFFADVLKSNELLSATLRTPFDVPDANAPKRPLLDLLDVSGSTPERRFGNALRKFEQQVVVDVNRKSGIVKLNVTLHDPTLSAAVAQRMFALLNQFNLERRQRSSTEQRRFAEARLLTAQRELDSTENARLAFLESNRNYFESARLLARYDQLDRSVRVKEGILIGLTKTYEESRVAEVRDTPLLTVVDVAMPPDRPAQRPVLWGAIAIGVGFMVALLAVAIASIATLRAVASAPRVAPIDAPRRVTS